MYVERRYNIIGDVSAKALGYRAEWYIKGTLVIEINVINIIDNDFRR